MKERKKIALAFQGGGSHCVFSAGVAKSMFERSDLFDVVALSGTSGGAVNAAVAWCELVHNPKPDVGARLKALWDEVTANTVTELSTNVMVRALSKMSETTGVRVNPYLQPPLARDNMLKMIESHVDFTFPPNAPDLYVGALCLNTGEAKVFKNEEVDEKSIMASCCLPDMFRAEEIGGNFYWDGMYGKNPPILEPCLDAAVKPEEIWVIAIEPIHVSEPPKRNRDIKDHKLMFMSSLSLRLSVEFLGHSRPDIKIRIIEMPHRPAVSTRLSIDSVFMNKLFDSGVEVGRDFMKKVARSR